VWPVLPASFRAPLPPAPTDGGSTGFHWVSGRDFALEIGHGRRRLISSFVIGCGRANEAETQHGLFMA